MKLSILICTVEERKEQFNKLFNRIVSLVVDFNGVEVLYNDAPRYDLPGGLTVGEKRQALIDKAKGKYIMFVDDDDDIYGHFITDLYPLLEQDVDVINAKVQSYIDGKSHIINQSIYFDSEQLQDGETKRYPSVMSVWNRELTNKAKFKPLNNGEDFDWTKQMNPQSEIKVDSIWQIYNYSSINNIASKAERKCIVTFSNTDRYNALANRLGATAKQYGYDFIHYKTYEEINCKPHTEYPYAFKPYSIQKAREQGYNNILWLDSAIYLTKDPKEVFKYIKDNGVMLFDNIGFSIASYTHDDCLRHFAMERSDAERYKMVMACAMGFNFNTKIGTDTFNKYLGFAHTNAFQGSWSNHRHDQSVISCIAVQNQIELLHPNKTFIAYEGNEGMLPHAESVCLISNG
jgi:hypothetical protein